MSVSAPPVPAEGVPVEVLRRPRVKPALRRLWRDQDSLQLGLEPPHAVVLCGVGAAQRQVLDLLDGTRTVPEVVAAAAEAGVGAEDVGLLIDTLRRAGALDDVAAEQLPRDDLERRRLEPDLLSLSLQHPCTAPTALLHGRRAAAVRVHGTGRVGATVATLLAAAGVGWIGCVDPAPARVADTAPGGVVAPGLSTRAAATVARLRAWPHTAAAADSADDAAASSYRPLALAVVATDAGVPTPEVVTAVREHPHLLVAVRETTAVIGPFVLPGRTPCVRCLELSRSERDLPWPVLAAQLAAGPRAVEPCDVVLATAAASLAALHVLHWIDTGRLPPTAGGVLEMEIGAGRMRRRSITAHPDCGCGG